MEPGYERIMNVSDNGTVTALRTHWARASVRVENKCCLNATGLTPQCCGNATAEGNCASFVLSPHVNRHTRQSPCHLGHLSGAPLRPGEGSTRYWSNDAAGLTSYNNGVK